MSEEFHKKLNILAEINATVKVICYRANMYYCITGKIVLHDTHDFIVSSENKKSQTSFNVDAINNLMENFIYLK